MSELPAPGVFGSMDPIQAMELEQKRAVVDADKRLQKFRDDVEVKALERVPEAFRKAQVIPLVFYPDDRLAMECKPVSVFDKGLDELVHNMALTMYLCGGVGLAAPQVGIDARLLICDWGERRGNLQVLVNPVLLDMGGPIMRMEEACLSIPGARVHIERPEQIVVQYQDVKGRSQTTTLSDWPARIVQHEVDHLDGCLMLDRASRLERRLAERRFAKITRGEAARKPKGKRRR